MKKVILFLIFFGLAAIPLIAEDGDQPPAPEDFVEKEKEILEEEFWFEIQKLTAKYSDKTQSREELSKIINQIHDMYIEYIENFFGVNKERSVRLVSSAMSILIHKGEIEKFLELSEEWIKADFLDARTKARISEQRFEQLIANNPEKALEKVNENKLREGEELKAEDLIFNANILQMKARIYLKLKKDKEFAEIEKQLIEIRENTTEDRVKQFVRYYLMKINVDRIVAGVVAPEWTLKDFDGKEFKLSEFKDKVVLLDFWATWCPPCRTAMENHLKPLWEKYQHSKDFIIISIGLGSVRETIEKEREFVEKMGYKWLFLFDADGEAAMAYGATAIPKLVLIDKAGEILNVGNAGIMNDVKKYVEENCTVGEEPKKEVDEEEF